MKRFEIRHSDKSRFLRLSAGYLEQKSVGDFYELRFLLKENRNKINIKRLSKVMKAIEKSLIKNGYKIAEKSYETPLARQRNLNRNKNNVDR